MTTRTNPTTAALAGLKVIDLTRVLAGPLATMMLADLGADVIKVEPPNTGDDVRAWGPPFVSGESAYFMGFNRNKRSIVLDLSKEEGRAVLKAMIQQADVLVDNYKVGTLEKWGITTAWMESHAPRVVWCSITGYGTTGPKAALPGYDFILQAETGLMSITGASDAGATKHGVPIVDITTGLLACNAILAALQSRHHTGRGQRVEASLYDSGLYLLANVGNSALASGKEAVRLGNGHPNVTPYVDYPTADGRIAVCIGNEAQFARFAELVNRKQWLTDPRFASVKVRVENRVFVDGEVSEALKTRSTADWLQVLRAAGIACGPINSVQQVFADPHTAARDMIVETDHPTAGTVKSLGNPIKLHGTPTMQPKAAPRLGEHTDEVLRNELSFDDEMITALHAKRVI